MVYQLAEGVNLHVLPTKNTKRSGFLSVLLRVCNKKSSRNVHFSAACWKQIV